jgi:hypothetical protein
MHSRHSEINKKVSEREKMPKVREGYAEKKKQEILEAAKRVCKSKPVHDVAMRDIVLEAGSQLCNGTLIPHSSSSNQLAKDSPMIEEVSLSLYLFCSLLELDVGSIVNIVDCSNISLSNIFKIQCDFLDHKQILTV